MAGFEDLGDLLDNTPQTLGNNGKHDSWRAMPNQVAKIRDFLGLPFISNGH